LITGASGGVGRFAVRLASAAGAHVIASVGRPERGAGLAELGADEVVVGLESVDTPVDVVLDNVGGQQLVAAWQLLAPGGTLQSIGWTSGEPAVFPPYSTIGPPKSLTSFLNEGSVAADLTDLVRLVESGVLPVEIGWQAVRRRHRRTPWSARQRQGRPRRGRFLVGQKIFLDKNILVCEYYGPWTGSHQHSGTRRGGASWSSSPSALGLSVNWLS
jgi:NADPH:quinone reductase-like Zn-dependent oxidoreductase